MCRFIISYYVVSFENYKLLRVGFKKEKFERFSKDTTLSVFSFCDYRTQNAAIGIFCDRMQPPCPSVRTHSTRRHICASFLVSLCCVCYGPPHPSAAPTNRYGTQHVQALSKEDKIKLESSMTTGCVDGSTPRVWYGRCL